MHQEPVAPTDNQAQLSVLPPEVATRLAELEASWNTRLKNQQQVIANLDEDRVRVMGQRDTLFSVLKEMQRILTHDYDASDQLELWHQLKEMVNKAVEE